MSVPTPPGAGSPPPPPEAPPTAPAPQSGPPRPPRFAGLGEVAALVSAGTALLGLLLGFLGLPALVNSPTARTGTATETVHATATVTVTATPSQPTAPGTTNPPDSTPTPRPSPSRANIPEAQSYTMDLPVDHSLVLGSSPPGIAGQIGEFAYWGGTIPRVEVSEGYGTLVLLSPGQDGGYEACRTDTRYSRQLRIEDLSKGAKLCVVLNSGHIALIAIRAMPYETSRVSAYFSLDITVWRKSAS